MDPPETRHTPPNQTKVNPVPAQGGGWAAVEKSVRDFDEQVVQDYKEDIDTLLTFVRVISSPSSQNADIDVAQAGLFSAALTALLAISYAMLQEDTAGEMLQVMRRIADQTAGYMIQGNFLNTTASPPPPPTPFTPSPTAVRINTLWFASLICSLATASVGILVKQWLRAFLACKTTTSAQGRLRVRMYRSPGLETWMVFEIAEVLPLLIQASLALFFIGLCFFTMDSHPTLGHTTIALVAGWAVFFFFVTICPVFSPRCPYKTAFLENGLAWFCRGLRWMLHRIRDRGATGPVDERDAAKYTDNDLDILAAADRLQSNDELLGTAVLEALVQSQPSVDDVVQFLLKLLYHRMPLDFLLEMPTLLVCRPLSQQAKEAFLNMLLWFSGDNIGHYAGRFTRDGRPLKDTASWASHILVSLLQDLVDNPLSLSVNRSKSELRHQLPPATAQLVQAHLQTNGAAAWVTVLSAQFQSRIEVHPDSLHLSSEVQLVIESLCYACRAVDANLPQMLGYFKAVFAVVFDNYCLPEVTSYNAFSDSIVKIFSDETVEQTIILIAQRLNDEAKLHTQYVTTAAQFVWSRTHEDALILVLRLMITRSGSWAYGWAPLRLIHTLCDSSLPFEGPLKTAFRFLMCQPQRQIVDDILKGYKIIHVQHEGLFFSFDLFYC